MSSRLSDSEKVARAKAFTWGANKAYRVLAKRHHAEYRKIRRRLINQKLTELGQPLVDELYD